MRLLERVLIHAPIFTAQVHFPTPSALLVSAFRVWVSFLSLWDRDLRGEPPVLLTGFLPRDGLEGVAE